MTAMSADPPILLTQAEVAEILQVEIVVLRRWHRMGIGPRPSSPGRPAAYDLADVQAFLTAGLATEELNA